METILRFTSFDGTPIEGILNRPFDDHIRGVFLLMHGIPSGKDEWGFYSDMAMCLSENNFASFRFDFRYNGNKEPLPMTDLTLSGMVNDIEAAYIFIKKQFLDHKFYVVGTSCGGGVTVRWLNVFNHNIDGCFLMAPVLDYVFEATGITRRDLIKHNYELPLSIVETLNEGYVNQDIRYGKEFFNDAILFDGKNELTMCSKKVIIIQGTDDTVVPIGITKYMIEGLDIKLIEIPCADHGFAVEGDDLLTFPETKKNHYSVYQMIVKELSNDATKVL